MITIIVGIGKDKNGLAIEISDINADILCHKVLARHFAGWTLIQSEGGWTNPADGKLNVERGRTVLLARGNNDFAAFNVAQELRDTFSQSCVAIDWGLGGPLEFV
jgi:hypothetical protein